MIETAPDGMRNASGLTRQGVTCAGCSTFSVTAVEGLFSNPRVGPHSVSVALRVESWRGVDEEPRSPEDSLHQTTGGRSRRLWTDIDIPTVAWINKPGEEVNNSLNQ